MSLQNVAEREVVNTRKGTMKLISMALEKAEIEFINDEEGWVGVRLNLDWL